MPETLFNELNMVYESGKAVLTDEPQLSFETVLDETCRILEDKQIQYSLRRIKEFDERLEDLERELDAFIENFEILG